MSGRATAVCFALAAVLVLLGSAELATYRRDAAIYAAKENATISGPGTAARPIAMLGAGAAIAVLTGLAWVRRMRPEE